MHLTNASVQKKHPEYEAKRLAMIEAAQTDKVQTTAGASDAAGPAERDGNIWSMEAFAQYMEAHAADSAGAAVASSFGGGGMFVREELPRQIKEVMVEVHKASRGKLKKQRGYFDLLGFDFMLDEQLQLHLLEVNTNPALHVDGAVHKTMLPALVQHSLEAVLHAQPPDSKTPQTEEGDSKDAPEAPMALKSIGAFELIVDEATGYEWDRNENAASSDGEGSPRTKLKNAQKLDAEINLLQKGEAK